MNRSTSREALVLLMLDLVGLICFYNITHQIRLGSWIPLTSAPLWVLILIAVMTLYVMDVYRVEYPETRSQLPLKTFTAVLVVALGCIVFVYTIGIAEFVPIFGRGVLPFTMLLFAIWAPFCRWMLTRMRQERVMIKHWLVVADTDLYASFSADVQNKFEQMHCSSMKPTDDLSVLKDWVSSNPDQSGIVFQNNQSLTGELASQMMELRFSGVPILTVNEFYEQYWLKLPLIDLQDGWFIHSRGFNLLHDHIGVRLKRLVDFVVGVVGVIVLSPFLLMVSLLIRLTSKGDALFKQHRVGLNGRVFKLYKFRTMVDDAESMGAQWAQKNDPRITGVGRFLRASRIDELPQLWNLIRGEMSLIGPRPERPEFIEQLEKQIPYYDVRHLVPPGITGWAQVMYPYGANVEDARRKLEYDLYYIKNHSIQLDLAIAIKTLMVMLRGRGR
ncbi:MAG: sugar transferase [Pseudomonadota bacterium]